MSQTPLYRYMFLESLCLVAGVESEDAGCTVSAFKPSSVIGCFRGVLMVLCSILSAARKKKVNLTKEYWWQSVI